MKKIILLTILMGILINAKSQEQVHLYPFLDHDKVGCINNLGEVVIPAKFHNCYSNRHTCFHEGIACVETSDGKFCYINETGQYISSIQFDEGDAFSDNRALVKINGLYGFISQEGEYAIVPQFISAKKFSEGYAAVKNQDGLWGYINQVGEFAIEPRFSCANSFSEGYAAVCNKDDLWGYINNIGEYEIIPLYNSAGEFINGISIVGIDGKTGIIDKSGKFVYLPKKVCDVEISDNGVCGIDVFEKCLLFDYKLYLWQLIKSDGQIIGTKEPLFIFHGFSEGLAEVGIVDDPNYDNCATRNYYIDIEGNVAIDHELSERYCMVHGEKFSEGYAAVFLYDYKKKKQVGYGYIDKRGNVVIAPQFEKAGAFVNGIAHVKLGRKKEGYINKRGEIIFTYKTM